MGVYLGAVILAALAVPVVLASKRKFEECLPVSTIAMIVLLFLFGVLNILKAAVYVIALLAVLSIALGAFWAKRHGGIKSYTGLFLTPGFFLFVLIVLIMPVVCHRQALSLWDEFSHWGLAAKDMYLFDAMGYRPGTYVTMWGVPPFITLFQYFFLKVSGAYSEPVLYAAHHIMLFILLLPVCRWIQPKKWQHIVLTGAIFFLMPLLFFLDYWRSILVDSLMGVAIAYPISAYFLSEKKDSFAWIASAFGIGFLVMLKNTGLEYAVIPVVLIAADALFIQRKKNRAAAMPAPAEGGRKPLRRGVLIVLCLLIAFGSKLAFDAALFANGHTSPEAQIVIKLWNAVKGTSDETAEIPSSDDTAEAASGSDAAALQSDMSNELATAITGENASFLFLKGYQVDGIKAFIRFWESTNKVAFGFMEISYWSLFFLFAAGGALILWALRREEDFRSLRLCVIGSLVGFWVYAVITLAGIIFVFSARQASVLQSFERYLASYYFAMLILFFQLLVQRLNGKKPVIVSVVLLWLSLTALSPMDALLDIVGYHFRTEGTRITETLPALNADTDKVAFVSQGDRGNDLICASYYALPLRVEKCLGWSFTADKANANDMHTYANAEQWEEALEKNGFTHVYICKTNEYFNEEFSSLFADPNSIADHTLFRIVTVGDGIQLEEVTR